MIDFFYVHPFIYFQSKFHVIMPFVFLMAETLVLESTQKHLWNVGYGRGRGLMQEEEFLQPRNA